MHRLRIKDDKNNSFFEKSECVFDQFPKYHLAILLGDFNAEAGIEDIFKATFRNKSLYEISNDNEMRVVNSATSKNLIIKSTMFLHHYIHKHRWTSPGEKARN
jgi:hypothetical protein